MRDIWRECVVIIGYASNDNTSIYIRMHACIPSHYPKKTKNNKSFIHCFKIRRKTEWPSHLGLAATSKISPSKTSKDVEYSKQPGGLNLFCTLGVAPFPVTLCKWRFIGIPSWKCKIPGGRPHLMYMHLISTASHEELAPNGPMISYVLTFSNLSFHHHYCNSHNQRKWVDIHIKAQWFITIGEINNNKWDTLTLTLTQIWLMTSPPRNHML